MESIRRGITQAFNEVGAYGRAIIDAARHYDIEHLRTNFEWARKFHDPDFVVGFGIGGIERPGDLAAMGDLFELALKENIPISAHIEETDKEPVARNLISATQQDAIKRIGHALGIQDLSPAEIEDLISKGKFIEVCLSSNLQLGFVSSLSEHPIHFLFKHDIPFNINTDDSTIFKTTLRREMAMARKALNIDTEQSRQINMRALQYAFCTDSLKEVIINYL